jgi:hypothetical protein
LQEKELQRCGTFPLWILEHTHSWLLSRALRLTEPRTLSLEACWIQIHNYWKLTRPCEATGSQNATLHCRWWDQPLNNFHSALPMQILTCQWLRMPSSGV